MSSASTMMSSCIFLVLALACLAAAQFSIVPLDSADGPNPGYHATLSWEIFGWNSPYTSPVVALRGQTSAFPQSPISFVIPFNGSATAGLNSTTIAYISCDAADYKAPGSASPAAAYTAAANAGAAAILLFSYTAPGCKILGTPDPTGYMPVWSLTTNDQTTFTSPEEIRVSLIVATIGAPQNFGYDAAYQNLTGIANVSTSNTSHPPIGHVAMIVLYVITGLVSVLFLGVIAMGFVRTLRHPERYGPRAALAGQRQQTRAGGLARAMLDSLPIVKFGTPETTKESDLELASAKDTVDSPRIDEAPTGKDQSLDKSPESSPEHSPDLDRASVHSGIGPANVTTERAKSNHIEVLSCSICTDDFEAGQDMRVLPCDHKFHPECVDPWLVNVSGTCPMCRIDLNPHPPQTAAADDPALVSPEDDFVATRRRGRFSVHAADLASHASPASRLRQLFHNHTRRQAAASTEREDAAREATPELTPDAAAQPAGAAAPESSTVPTDSDRRDGPTPRSAT